MNNHIYNLRMAILVMMEGQANLVVEEKVDVTA